MEQELVKDISLLYEKDTKFTYNDVVDIVRKHYKERGLIDAVDSKVDRHMSFEKDKSKEKIISLVLNTIKSYYQEKEFNDELLPEFKKAIDNYFLKRNNVLNEYHKKIDDEGGISGGHMLSIYLDQYVCDKINNLMG